jgi:HEAT repeat protein
VTEIAEWFDVGVENRPPVRAVEVAPLTLPDDQIGTMQDDAGHEFAPVSVPESNFVPEVGDLSAGTLGQLGSENPAERAAAVNDLPRLGGEEAFRRVSAAFDDQSPEVRSAAARAMFELQEDRAAAFTRALREATPERRRKIGSAIASSGLANEAIRNLTGESRDKTYDAFSLLFLMSKAGETQPLMRAIEEHSNIEVRLAVVKLLALSGQPDILPAFRRMAVRGSLPPEVRSAVMEAIYQITSQTPAEAPSML